MGRLCIGLGSAVGGRSLQFEVQNFTEIGNMGWSREPKGMTAPAVIGAVLGKHLETGFGFVQPICVVGWVTWKVYGYVLVSVNICISRARGKVCMEQDGAWGFNLKDRTPLLEIKDYGLEQGTKKSDSPATTAASHTTVQ